MPRLHLTPLLALVALLSGCAFAGEDPVSGYLWTSMKTPYTVDLDNTPVVSDSGDGSVLRIREPFTGYGVYTELNSNAIADIAARHGMRQVYFADLETFSLFNIWRSQTLTLYGR